MVLGDADALKDSKVLLKEELALLKDLDLRIERLQMQEKSDEPDQVLSREKLDQLLYESMQWENELSAC